MPNWIPVAAVFGLLALMVIPAPGIMGVLIGAVCILAIAMSALVWLLDRAATGFLGWRRRIAETRRARRRKAVHAGSGMARKA